MADTKKVYWDSCVWISLINQEAGRVENCQAMEEAAKKCSGVNGQIEGSKDPDFEAFIEQDFVTEVQVDHDIAVVARRLLRSNQQLKKPADAIHLATAVLYNLDEFHTYDGDNRTQRPIRGPHTKGKKPADAGFSIQETTNETLDTGRDSAPSWHSVQDWRAALRR